MTDILDLIEVRDGRIASLTTFFDTAYAAALAHRPEHDRGCARHGTRIAQPLPRRFDYSFMTSTAARRGC